MIISVRMDPHADFYFAFQKARVRHVGSRFFIILWGEILDEKNV